MLQNDMSRSDNSTREAFAAAIAGMRRENPELADKMLRLLRLSESSADDVLAPLVQLLAPPADGSRTQSKEQTNRHHETDDETLGFPTLWETLAGCSKVVAIKLTNPGFYDKHVHAIEFASSFFRVLASSYPPLENAFTRGLSMRTREAAILVQGAFREIDLSEAKMEWFDRQSTEVLRMLLEVVRDPELPSWLRSMRWAVEGAFERPDAG
jgi:hypothetical protein